MKTLINKANPAIRITAPEIVFNAYGDYHIKGFRCTLYIDDWTLVEEEPESNAQTAIERIDKYINEHTANAHDMKDSDPNKNYYSGVDKTLSDIAGILQGIKSEKQTELVDFEKEIGYAMRIHCRSEYERSLAKYFYKLGRK